MIQEHPTKEKGNAQVWLYALHLAHVPSRLPYYISNRHTFITPYRARRTRPPTPPPCLISYHVSGGRGGQHSRHTTVFWKDLKFRRDARLHIYVPFKDVVNTISRELTSTSSYPTVTHRAFTPRLSGMLLVVTALQQVVIGGGERRAHLQISTTAAVSSPGIHTYYCCLYQVPTFSFRVKFRERSRNHTPNTSTKVCTM